MISWRVGTFSPIQQMSFYLEFNWFSQFEYAMPNPEPVPKTIGHALLLNKASDNIAPGK